MMMNEDADSPAPRCTHCGRLYSEGRRGVCSACLQARRRTSRVKPYRAHRKSGAVCQCGKPAVTVIRVTVGRTADGLYSIYMPLCQDCWKLEREMWEE